MYGFYRAYEPPPKPSPKDKKLNSKYGKLTDKEFYNLRWGFIFDVPSVVAPVFRSDVAGIDHIVKELDLHIRLIKNFKALDEQKAELDTGLLFTGPPGSGKSFCARYLATESEARFIDVGDFPRRKSMFTAEDIVELFGLMKKFVTEKGQPIIAFWDEFDRFAESGKDSEKIEALARFKTELSGIKGKLRGVFIIAATNRFQVIPPDITRRGRLGKMIYFGALRRGAKQNVLEHFVKKYEHDQNIDFESLSFLIEANYPADIEELVKDGWRNAIMANLGSESKPRLTINLLINTFIRQTRGTPRDFKLRDEELGAIAIYEIGRAIISRTLKFPVQFLALERDGYADAHRIAEDEYHSAYVPLSRLRDEIAACYGGILAQEMCGIESNSKQIEDFMTITTLAQRYVEDLRATRITTDISISVLAGIRGKQGLPPSVGIAEKTMYETKEEMSELIGIQQERVKATLNHYGKDYIEKAAAGLIEKEYMLQANIDAILKTDFVMPPDSYFEKKRKKRPGFKG